MEREQPFVMWLVGGISLVALLGMGGCDYWPPALQAQIEELRTGLHEALDENQRLQHELTDLRKLDRNSQLDPDEFFTRLDQQAPRSLQMHPPPQPVVTSAGAKAAQVDRHAAVSNGQFDPLQLERPHRQGARIVQLQRLLQRHQIPILADGVYGPATDAAVRRFQQHAGLPIDGVVGPVTYRALHRTRPAPTLVRPIWLQRPLITGPEVVRLQRALRRAGHRLPLDGRFGQATQKAVKQFQRRHGMAQDGVVGPKTWTALRATP